MLHEINAQMALQTMTLKMHFISCVRVLQEHPVSKEFRTQETNQHSKSFKDSFLKNTVLTKKVSRNAMFRFDSKKLGVCQTLNIKTKDKK